jgi:hypothetical protein
MSRPSNMEIFILHPLAWVSLGFSTLAEKPKLQEGNKE